MADDFDPAAVSDPTLVRAENLGFSHAGAPLLQGLGFAIGPGLALVRGGDGRGKSTLLRLIAGLLPPGEGRVHRSVSSLYFEEMADPVHDAVPAGDWLAARAARFAGWSAAVQHALVDDFALAEHLGKPLYKLSTGSRRKVGLVAAAASGAQLTLLDVPFAALDGPSRDRLARLLAEAAAGTERAWVIADYALPAALAGTPLAAQVDLGD